MVAGMWQRPQDGEREAGEVGYYRNLPNENRGKIIWFLTNSLQSSVNEIFSYTQSTLKSFSQISNSDLSYFVENCKPYSFLLVVFLEISTEVSEKLILAIL